MADLKQLLANPDYYSLPFEEQHKALQRVSPEYAGLSQDEQTKFINKAQSRHLSQVSSQPTGFEQERKGDVRTSKRGMTGQMMENAPTIGASVGGLAGAGLASIPMAAIGGAAGKAVQTLYNAKQGEVSPSAGQDIKGIVTEGAEQGAFEGGGQLIRFAGKLIRPTSRAASIAYATRSGHIGSALDKLVPEFDKTLGQQGASQVRTIGEFDRLVNDTNHRLETEFGQALQPIRGNQVVPQTVSNSILGKITSNMSMTPEGQAAEKLLRKQARLYQRPWTIDQLNNERMLVGDRLRTWHNAVASGQAAVQGAQAHIAADTATEQALKDLLYDEADRSGSKPQGYFRDLKAKQSALYDLADATDKAKEKLSKSSLESKGAPLREKIHIRAYSHPLPGAGLTGGIPVSSMLSDPLEQSNAALKRAFPTRGRRIGNAARNIGATAVSNPTLDALPLRLLAPDLSGQ